MSRYEPVLYKVPASLYTHPIPIALALHAETEPRCSAGQAVPPVVHIVSLRSGHFPYSAPSGSAEECSKGRKVAQVHTEGGTWKASFLLPSS